MVAFSSVGILSAWVLAPLLPSLVNRVKAVFAGRRGAPLLQPYYDILKLLRKGSVFSRTTTWVFVAGPLVSVATALVASLLIPLGAVPAPLRFSGDIVLLAALFGFSRFMTVLAALDTGSSFEGMGASREAQFSALAEPAFLLALSAVVLKTGEASLSGMFAALTADAWRASAAPLLLSAAALGIVFLAENARIPVDDPNTHLELTMVHEVMVLDHGGPLLALVHYGAALKFWVLGAVFVNVVCPFRPTNPWLALGITGAGLLTLAVAVGAVESTMARLRLLRVPTLLLGAGALSVLSLALLL